MAELKMYTRDASWHNVPGVAGAYHAPMPSDRARPACGRMAVLEDRGVLATKLRDYQVCRQPGCWNRWSFANGRCPKCGQDAHGYEVKKIKATFTGVGLWGQVCDEQEQDTCVYPAVVTCPDCGAKFDLKQATGEDYEKR